MRDQFSIGGINFIEYIPEEDKKYCPTKEEYKKYSYQQGELNFFNYTDWYKDKFQKGKPVQKKRYVPPVTDVRYVDDRVFQVVDAFVLKTGKNIIKAANDAANYMSKIMSGVPSNVVRAVRSFLF